MDKIKSNKGMKIDNGKMPRKTVINSYWYYDGKPVKLSQKRTNMYKFWH